MKTVKVALLLVGLGLAGNLFAAEIDDYGRRVTRPEDTILMPNLTVNAVASNQLVGYIDADVLNFRNDTVINRTEKGITNVEL